GEEKLEFNLFNSAKNVATEESCFHIYVIDQSIKKSLANSIKESQPLKIKKSRAIIKFKGVAKARTQDFKKGVHHSTWAVRAPNMVLHHHHPWLPMMGLPASIRSNDRIQAKERQRQSSPDPANSVAVGYLQVVQAVGNEVCIFSTFDSHLLQKVKQIR
ncbi:hypothetical protein ACLOJK_038629, partial [Asimina triloba]